MGCSAGKVEPVTGASTRPLGRIVAAGCLVVLSPVMLLAAVGIKLSSRGPVFYRASRVGRHGELFTMLKLRTMRVRPVGVGARITGSSDDRIFPVGRWLRRFKLDELPQLLNVLRGEMAIVGPRPEDPTIVAEHYTSLMRETLNVLPGLTSPGSLTYYADEAALPASAAEAERVYLSDILPRKIALDLVYIRNRSWWYDAEVMLRTTAAIVGWHSLFRRRRAWELAEAEVFRRDSTAGLRTNAS